MSPSTVTIICPRCRMEYSISVDLDKLMRLRTRAVCSRCGEKIDIAERLAQAELREARQSSSDIWASSVTGTPSRPPSTDIWATSRRRPTSREREATETARQISRRRLDGVASGGPEHEAETKPPQLVSPGLGEYLLDTEPSPIEQSPVKTSRATSLTPTTPLALPSRLEEEQESGPPPIPDLTAELVELSPWLELADPGLDALVAEPAENATLLEALLTGPLRLPREPEGPVLSPLPARSSGQGGK